MSDRLLNDHLTRIERPEPVSTEVVRRLVDLLLSGKIAVGERLPSERQLATALGVGRSAIRDALRPLALLGLVDVRVGDGTYLKDADSFFLPRVIEWGLLLKADRMRDLIETRRYVEITLAGLAAERRDPESLAMIHETLHQMKDAVTNPAAFVQADMAFHLAIADAARNRVLSGILTNLQSLLLVWISRVIEAAGEARSSYLEHPPILAAIELGDRRAAEAAMAAHIDKVTEGLMNSLRTVPPEKRVRGGRRGE
jgi:GntR family transcriptional regulator, transcriptional repressor for pyruvate dehydrogenase complex